MDKNKFYKERLEEIRGEYAAAAKDAEALWGIAHGEKVAAYKRFKDTGADEDQAAFLEAKAREDIAHQRVMETKGIIVDAENDAFLLPHEAGTDV